MSGPDNPEAKLWGGRFVEPTAPAMERFSASLSYDYRLAAAELAGSQAHAQGLAGAGVLSAAELEALTRGLEALADELAAAPESPRASGAEDVHTWVHQRLLALAGPAALKLQTGRSRNEQVALDLRLYLRSRQPAITAALAALLDALADFAERHAEVLIPGYTHMQRAQPISLGHHALAYAEMLLRDAGRLRDAFSRLSVSPLGSGALAGTPWKVDREAMARALGLRGVTQNSLDAVADRDFAVEVVFVLALLALHLSRFAEDWILYSTAEFGWIVIGDAYATGSSLMPQKKNADALELIRGKAARQTAHLDHLLGLIKGLPLAYNRDLQEDKEPVFDAVETAVDTLTVAAGVVATAGVDAARAAAAVDDAALLATDLADLLVESGVAFHEAHQIVGRIVTAGLERQRDFRQFTDEELAHFSPALDPARVRALSAQASVNRRASIGGTAVVEVRRQAARVRQLARGL